MGAVARPRPGAAPRIQVPGVQGMAPCTAAVGHPNGTAGSIDARGRNLGRFAYGIGAWVPEEKSTTRRGARAVTATQKPLGAIAPWFGGKRTMAPDIVRLLGPHRAYFEPMCGSAAVLCAKDIVPNEMINDLHRELINLAMVVASDRWLELYRMVDRLLISEDWLRYASTVVAQDHPAPVSVGYVERKHVQRAAFYLATSWMGRNGVSGTARPGYQIACRFTQGGGSPGVRWRAAVDSVPPWHDRLKGVVILNRDAFDVIEKIDDADGVAIYCDPPYLTPAGYLHEFSAASDLFAGRDDHQRLADALTRFERARVVVSYYAHERLPTLYPPDRWRHIDATRSKNLSNVQTRGTVKSLAPEVLIVNEH